MRYEEGRIPKTLRRWLDRNSEKVAAVSHGGGYCTDSGDAYDVLMEPGWRVQDGMHTIIEATVSDTLAKLRTAEPCDCADCRREKEIAK